MRSELESTIKYKFKNSSLLDQALLHRSKVNELKLHRIDSNERLEFLGDAVLELVSSNYLYQLHPDWPEGELTKSRASMVCETSLSYCALELGLDKYVEIGKGEEKSGGRKKPSIISDALESLIGAIYLDGGYDQAKEFILEFIISKQSDVSLFLDSKSKLQELVQTKGSAHITYEIVSESGPDHNKKFEIKCIVNDEELATGIGNSKKSAEQDAAYNSLKILNSRS